MPSPPSQKKYVDYKGPIGGKSGFYYHVVIDLYSHYWEVSIVQDTKFESLKPKLEEIWSRFGILKKIVHHGRPPYNSWEWKRYAKQIGCILVLCSPEHPQSNGMAEKIMTLNTSH